MHLKQFLLFLLITIFSVKSQTNQEFEEPPFREEESEFKKGKCYRPPEFYYRQCCIFPPFYSRVVAVECGAKTIINFYDKKENVTAATRILAEDDCQHWRCVLQKYKQLDGANDLNLDKYYRHLDKWADLNPKFKGVISQAQGRAKVVFRMKFPIHVCQFIDLNNFIRYYVTLDCPAVIPTPECYDQKQMYQDCREYFLV